MIQFIVLTVLVILILLLVFTQFYPKQSKTETFKDSDSYAARLAVINMFDKHLRRNPSPKEITHYSQFVTEKSIMEAISNDFPDEISIVQKRNEKKVRMNKKKGGPLIDKLGDKAGLQKKNTKREIGGEEEYSDRPMKEVDIEKEKKEKVKEKDILLKTNDVNNQTTTPNNQDIDNIDSGDDESDSDSDSDSDDDSDSDYDINSNEQIFDEMIDDVRFEKENVNEKLALKKLETIQIPRTEMVNLEKALSRSLSTIQDILNAKI